jgi:glycosyltransferase involved in cell wall biosynthesis
VRILFVISFYKPAYVYGGPVRSVPALCEGLVQAGAQVTVYTTNANGKDRLQVPLDQPICLDGVDTWYFPLGRIDYNFHSPRLGAAILNNVSQFDIVVSDLLWEHLMSAVCFACNREHVPYVVPLRGQLLPWSLQHSAIRKRIYLNLIGNSYLNRAAALHCTDPIEARYLANLNFKSPVMTIPNGVDLSRYKSLPVRGKVRERLGIPQSASVLLFLGRMHRKKRPEIAIKVCADINKLGGLPVYLILAGPDEGGRLHELQRLANQLGVTSNTFFTGLVNDDELLEVIVDSNLLIMPSENGSENFGMSALEALAAGVPVLVSEGVPVGYWAEQVGAGRIAQSDPQSFTHLAIELLSHPEALADMGRLGQGLVQQRFDISVIARQMLENYQAIIDTGKPLPGIDISS